MATIVESLLGDDLRVSRTIRVGSSPLQSTMIASSRRCLTVLRADTRSGHTSASIAKLFKIGLITSMTCASLLKSRPSSLTCSFIQSPVTITAHLLTNGHVRDQTGSLGQLVGTLSLEPSEAFAMRFRNVRILDFCLIHGHCIARTTRKTDFPSCTLCPARCTPGRRKCIERQDAWRGSTVTVQSLAVTSEKRA